MIKSLKLSKRDLLILIIIFVLYFGLRLPNLTLQPIFADEAIYIRWAQVMRSVPELRFLPLSDGKTPLFMWSLIPLFKFFPDPLFAGRFLSVLSGFFTLLGIIFLGVRFFNSRIGLWAGLLIAITPYILFFDRMALVDSMLSAFSIWSLNFALLLVRYQRLDLAMLLGYLLGGGILTKTPGFFNALSLPTSLMTFSWSRDHRESKVIKLFTLWLTALVIMFAIYNILRLGPGFSNLTSRNQDYVFSPYELQGRILDPFIPHFHDISDWFPKLLTIPTTILVILGCLWVVTLRRRYGIAVLLWLLVPLIVQMFFLKTFTARYILTSIPPLLLLGSVGIDQVTTFVRRKWLTVLLLAVVMGFSFQTDYLLITSPEKANLPRSERRGYLEDWTAGYGLREIAQFLDQKSKNSPVVVGTEGNFGTLPDGLQIYLDSNRRVSVIGNTGVVAKKIFDAAEDHPTYFVASRSQFSQSVGLQLIQLYPKAPGPDFPQDAMELFQVIPK